MNFVVSDFSSVKIMIEASVILGIIIYRSQYILEFKESPDIKFFLFKLFNMFEHFGKMILGIEDGRLVHIVPKAFQSGIKKYPVIITEPFSDI